MFTWETKAQLMAVQRDELGPAQIVDYIEANYHRAISPHDVATALNYSLSYLTHRTRKLMGYSLGDLILHRRLAAARQLLIETSLSVSRVALRVGFTDVAYFSRRFSHEVGLSPTQWRRAHRAVAPAVCHACGRALPSIASADEEGAEFTGAAS